MRLGPTPSQTIGPFFTICLPGAIGPVADPNGVLVSGRVLDGAGDPIADALVETWQAAPSALASSATDDDGRWQVRVPTPEPVGEAAPHLAVVVFARGLLRHLVTRVYLPEQEEANRADPVLAQVPADRRKTLVATRTDDGYRFEIRIQGPGETVFFDV